MTELRELRLQVIDHRVEAICCPTCQHVTTARFPAGVDAPAQYGPQMQALAVYLSQFQLLPMERIQELCVDLFGCSLSEGTLANWIAEAARTLGPTMLMVKRLLGWSRVNHVDETGARIKGLLHWFHVTATRLSDVLCLASQTWSGGHEPDWPLAQLHRSSDP